MKTLYTLIILITFSLPSYAHSGGTDSSGCHNDNINGGYHCHGGSSYSNSGSGDRSYSSGGQDNSAVFVGVLTLGAIIVTPMLVGLGVYAFSQACIGWSDMASYNESKYRVGIFNIEIGSLRE